MINTKALKTISKVVGDTIIKRENMIIKSISPISIVVASNKRAFSSWWRNIQLDPLTSSAAKYCRNPKHFKKDDVYVITTIDSDAEDVMNTICCYS